MGGSGSKIVAKMRQVLARAHEALVKQASPEINRTYRQTPAGLRGHLQQAEGAEQRGAAEVGRNGPAAHPDRRTAAEHPDFGTGAQRPVHRTDSTDGDGLLSPQEAQQLYERVQDRNPDFSGAANRLYVVETRLGPAVVRFEKENPAVTFLKKWMPENAAIAHARAGGVRTPRILYAGVGSSTRAEFTVMQCIPGRPRPFEDPELFDWLPDLLDQVQLISSRPVPAGLEIDIPHWQQQMIQHADDAYANLPQDHRSRLDALGIGPLSDYVQPDQNRAGEPVVFAHSDLYALNLQRDDRNKLWIFDWETAGPGDLHYNASMFIERLGKVDDATYDRATAMWTERLLSSNPGVDTDAALSMYRRMEDWRGTALTTGTLPELVAADPRHFDDQFESFHQRFSRNPDWPDFSRDELRAQMRGWLE